MYSIYLPFKIRTVVWCSVVYFLKLYNFSSSPSLFAPNIKIPISGFRTLIVNFKFYLL
ncbi:hypothetical protein KSS87_008873 [Heliosperma pusillum]|nr:hypothetical protein KSS87_008873 [Heliosperma pusillum]